MTILADWQIDALAEKGMIAPYVGGQVSTKDVRGWYDGLGVFHPDEHGSDVKAEKIISYGLSSFGYDITLAREFKAYNRAYSVNQDSEKWHLLVDPLNFNEADLLETFIVRADRNYAVIPPHGYFLGHSVEYIKMPRNINALCISKSTYARAGVLCNTTPIEAGWEGQITLEIANLTDRPVKLYVEQGICQLQFFKGEEPSVSYSDRKGKYQKQVGVTTPRG